MVPNWLIIPFRDLHADLDWDTVTITLHQFGVHCLFDDPDIEQRLGACDGHIKGRTLSIARQELDSDILHFRKIMLIRLWSNLNHFVIDTVSKEVRNNPSTRHNSKLRSIQTNASRKSIDINDDEWYFEQVEDAWKQVTRKLGKLDYFERFELLFGLLNIKSSNGPPHTISTGIRKCLNELGAVRNCLVHRRGIVDSKLLKAAPSLVNTCQVGDPLPTDRLKTVYYSIAIRQYTFSICSRLYAAYGGTDDEIRQDLDNCLDI